MRIGIITGNFQPFHKGHHELVAKALEHYDRVVVCILGSNRSLSSQRPFSTATIRDMVATTFMQFFDRISIVDVPSHPYDSDRQQGAIMEAIFPAVDFDLQAALNEHRVCNVCHERDQDRIVRFLPAKQLVTVHSNVFEWIESNTVRSYIFEQGERDIDLNVALTDEVLSVIKSNQGEVAQSLAEYNAVKVGKMKWVNSPYPPKFVTGDAIVEHRDHVLLITRDEEPGFGKRAIPGGHVNDESTLEAAIRELREETGIDISNELLCQSYQGMHLFDAPNRDPRGHYVTAAHHFKVPYEVPEFKVKGRDDAAAAHWNAIVDLCTQDLFIDHADVLETVMGVRIKEWRL